jgi:hypothetical protein
MIPNTVHDSLKKTLFISANAPPTPRTTKRPVPPVTRPPVTNRPLMKTDEETEPLNLPVVIGGGVSGFLLLLIIILVGGCLCMRRRSQSDEKSKGKLFSMVSC